MSGEHYPTMREGNEFVIDCEFDGPELLSIAIVPVGFRFQPIYIVNDRAELAGDPWVRENVLPVLHVAEHLRLPMDLLRKKVCEYLRSVQVPYAKTVIIADWWQDIIRLLRLIDHGDGTCEDVPDLDFSVRRIKSVSKHPHNAFFDAMAIRDEIIRLKGSTRIEGWKYP